MGWDDRSRQKIHTSDAHSILWNVDGASYRPRESQVDMQGRYDPHPPVLSTLKKKTKQRGRGLTDRDEKKKKARTLFFSFLQKNAVLTRLLLMAFGASLDTSVGRFLQPLHESNMNCNNTTSYYKRKRPSERANEALKRPNTAFLGDDHRLTEHSPARCIFDSIRQSRRSKDSRRPMS